MGDNIFDDFLQSNGHTEPKSWEVDYNKKKCPECFALHQEDATKCSVCNWSPNRE